MKVLIADDENLVRMSLVRALRARGHEVFEAADGNQALVLWKKDKPDLVVLDVLMPGLSGFQVLAEIRKLGGGRAVLMSAHAHPEEFGPSGQFQDVIFVAKPFRDIFEVAQMIEEQLCPPQK